VSDWYNQLVARGKKKAIAQVSVVRRMLHVAWVQRREPSGWLLGCGAATSGDQRGGGSVLHGRARGI